MKIRIWGKRMFACFLAFCMMVTGIGWLGTTEVRADDTTTVYFYNAGNWPSVKAYAYSGENQLLGAWPGTDATPDTEKGDKWWKITVPQNASVTPFNIILTSSEGEDAGRCDNYITSQTAVYLTNQNDTAYSSVSETEQAASGGTGGGSESGGGETTESTTVYFINKNGWSKVYGYAYANGTDAGTAWPGAEAVPAADKGDLWYQVTIPAAAPFGMIFHDGTDGTENRVELGISNATDVYVTTMGTAFSSVSDAETAEGIGVETDTTTVYFYNNVGWLKVNGYVYANDKPIGASWPGTAAEPAPEKGDNWYKLVVTKAVSITSFSVIFSEGGDNVNRAEVTLESGSEKYVTADGKLYDTAAAAEEGASGLGGGSGEAGGETGDNTDLEDYEVELSQAGAVLPYITYEAEDADSNVSPLQKSRTYLTDIQSEASGRSAVKLENTGDYVEFTLTQPANAFVLRYCIPDSQDGAGIQADLSMYADGVKQQKLNLTSEHAWIYGGYPYSNNPGDGKGHRFFDEVNTIFTGKTFAAGTKIRLQKDADDTAGYYIIDFLEAELVNAAKEKPENALSITDYGAVPDDGIDDYVAITSCIAAAKAAGKEVWIPAGTFELTAKKEIPVENVTIRGAGMWYSRLHGAGAAFKYTGTCKFYDFAMNGVATVRKDSEDLAAFEGQGTSTNVTLENIWIEHVKVGLWSYKTTNLVVQGCRIRNTYADGINLCSATNHATVRNNNIRNTGDDGIAIWPWQADSCNNTIAYNTVQLPNLANCIAVYGGSGNQVLYNKVYDNVNNGSGICVGTDYVTEKGFSGTTYVKNNELNRCGSWHCDYDYPVGALWIWATKSPMTAAFIISDNVIKDSSYEGILIDCWNTISGLVIRDTNIYGATDGIYARGNATGTMTFDNVGVSDISGELFSNEATGVTAATEGKGLYQTTTPEEGTKKKCAVVYHLNHADAVNAAGNLSEYEEGTTVSLQAPTLKGYTFAGWYTDAELTEGAKVQSFVITSDREFWAKWTKNGSDSEGGNQGGSQSGSESGNQGGSQSGSESGNQGGSQSGSESGNQGGSQSGSESGNQGGNQSGSEAGNQGGSQSGSEAGNQGGSKVTKIRLSGISKRIAAGKKLKLTAVVTPKTAADRTVSWKSSNTKYAAVNAKGVVTVKKAGAGKTVTITATAKDGSGKKASYRIKIMKKAVKKITLKAKTTKVKAGKKLTVKAVVRPSKNVNKKLLWSSSNTKYAAVNQKGVVTAKRAGKGKTVKIYAKATDGSNRKAVIRIKIK